MILIKKVLCLSAAVAVSFCAIAREATHELLDGVVLRAQEIPHDEDAPPETRLLLSTSGGLCAVRVPGGEGVWRSYTDAEVEIFGELQGMEFRIPSRSAVRVVKYPPMGPGSMLDVIPAGEMLYRQAVERERAEAARQCAALTRSWVMLALSLLALVVSTAVLALILRRSRRKAKRLGFTLDAERRRTGRLHENMEQQLTGAKMLLEAAISLSGEITPEPVARAVEKAAGVIDHANSKVHFSAANAARKLGEDRRG